MYYSNIAERILPIVDILFLRCFEVPVDRTVMETLLKAFAPIYRFHPQPVTFLYKLAYILDGHLPATKNATVCFLGRESLILHFLGSFNVHTFCGYRVQEIG